MKLNSLALQNALSKDLLREDKPQTGRKYLQKANMSDDCYPKCTKNFEHSTIRKATIWLKKIIKAKDLSRHFPREDV